MSKLTIKQGEPMLVVGDTQECALKRAYEEAAELRKKGERITFSVSYAVILTPLALGFESSPTQRGSKGKRSNIK